MVIEDELFDKDKGSHEAVKACAIEYPSHIVIFSDKDRKFVGFPNVIADHGATQRYAGVNQTNIPRRTAKAHYIKEHYPSDAIVVFLHQSEIEFPRTTFDCWMQGYDSLEYFFNWLVELKISSEGSSSG
ncbi:MULTISPECIES: hypothetical protein [unclassified Rhizobium]|uniref:hypothetical protein n=1 Tax=unclassified Rhizobium TaxID=2613769 RepID=UPI001785AA2A|nr:MULTISPECIES: hypothetical protein [unclassified Rhizobium]MBD8689594.1 hypothetical protein [Rhizobium sp. CFBP 13644]MBD8694201.1 hypothetical protein [Rhizobium sp. CFBP 13717]